MNGNDHFGYEREKSENFIHNITKVRQFKKEKLKRRKQ